VYEFYGWFLVSTGDVPRGLEEARRSVELDPLSGETNALYGFDLYFARRYEEAIAQLKKTLALDDTYYWAHEFLGRAYAQTGRPADAKRELLRSQELSGAWIPWLTAAVGRVAADSGDRVEALRILDELHTHAKTEYVPAYYVAHLEIGLGRIDDVFTHLEKSLEEKSLWTGWLAVDPDLDAIRADPRFGTLMKKCGFSAATSPPTPPRPRASAGSPS
jgi:tetratricopeptide (TPR) repeat protein